ncbi:MAG: LLM class flavin-dependent oxidoreductase [Myxococcota bacterium]
MSLGKLAITLPCPGLSTRECVELAVKAEQEWGYPAIWLAEVSGPDSFSLAGAIAQATSTIEIGTAIVPVYNRTPAVLAMTAATLADLSEGRFKLGLGTSSHAITEEWNGIPLARPLARVRETVTVLRQALAGEKTSLEGETLRSQGFRLGVRSKESAPVYLAALREKMLELAGEIGDGLILNLFPVSALPKILAAHRAGGARVGRDVSGQEVVCRFQVGLGSNVAASRDLVRLAFGGYVAQPVYNAYFRWCGFEKEAQAVADAFARRDRAATAAAMTDELIDRIAILGEGDACREQIAGFVAGGVTTPVLSPLAGDRPGVERVFAELAPAAA